MELPEPVVDVENTHRMNTLKRAATDVLHEIVDHIFLFHEHEKEWKTITSSTQRLFSDFKAHVMNTRNGKPSVYQVEVVKQRDPVSCGFHALHNACHALSALCDPKEEESKKHVHHIKSNVSFHLRHKDLRKKIKQKISDEKGENYPWTDDVYDIGVMERPFMNYLLETYHLTKKIGNTNITSLPEFSRGSMQVCSLEVHLVQRLEQVFENFKKQKQYSHAFVVGVTNHWVTLIGNKSDKGIELVLLDSRNTNFMNLSTEEMQKLITMHYDEREQLTGKKIEHRPWREKTYLVSMQDTVHALDLIYDCMTGSVDWIEYLCSLPFEKLCISGEDLEQIYATKLKESKEKPSKILESVLTSWSEFWHPTVLRNYLNYCVKLGKKVRFSTYQKLNKLILFFEKNIPSNPTQLTARYFTAFKQYRSEFPLLKESVSH